METKFPEDTPTEALINTIVSYRLLGMNKVLAVKCMEELSKRRNSGEEINYEEQIEQKLIEWKSKLPKSSNLQESFDFAKISSILSQLGVKS